MSRLRLALLVALLGLIALAVFVIKERGASSKKEETAAAESAGAPSPHGPSPAVLPSAENPVAPPDAADGAAQRSEAERLAEVQTIIANGANPLHLAKVIADGTAEPAALPARKAALAALRTALPKEQRQPALVMAAGNSSLPLPVERDPLWHDLVDATADTWTTESIQSGRDRMLGESDARARQLLVSSIAKFADSERGNTELTAQQKIGIRSDFIDIYRDMPEAQRRDMEAAVRRIAGEHAAELLRGIGTPP